MKNVWVHKGESPIVYRYIDWILTVPLQIIEFYLILSVATKIPPNVFYKLLGASILMIVFGFLGETRQINKYTGFAAGMSFFIYVFYTIYDTFAKHSEFGNKLFMVFTFIWFLYAVAYLMNPVIKNTMYNILDLISKNAFGIYLMYRVYQVAV